MGSPQTGARWPEHLPVGALRAARCARLRPNGYLLPGHHRLPAPETFHDSYGLDGTILGLPGVPFIWKIVRWAMRSSRHLGLISLRSTCPMPAPGSGSPRGWLPQASTRWCRSTTGRPTAALPTGTRRARGMSRLDLPPALVIRRRTATTTGRRRRLTRCVRSLP